MSEKPLGLRGTVVSSLIVAAICSFATWWLGDWGAFVAWNGRALRLVWSWLTAVVTVPWIVIAAPLLGLLAIIIFLIARLVQLPPSSVAGADVSSGLQLTAAEAHILRYLLQTGTHGESVGMIAGNAYNMPEMIIEHAGRSLEAKGYLNVEGQYPVRYSLTPAGKKLVIELWHAARR